MNNKLRQIRRNNTTKIIDVLREISLSTVREITEESGLSRVTVSKILSSLQSLSVVVEGGTGPTTTEGGKPPKLYSFDPKSRYLVGMHLFRDQLFGMLTDLNLKAVAETHRSIASDLGKEEVVDSFDETFNELLLTSGVQIERLLGIGIGTPGITDLQKGVVIHSPHNPSWGSDFRLRDLLGDRIGRQTPVYVDNAIRFRTIAETSIGELQNKRDGIVIHCDEGLIAGVLVDGSIKRGRHNLAGSIGHMTLNPQDKEQCDCGGYGCFEMQVKPERVVSKALQQTTQYPNSIISSMQTSDVTIQDIFGNADQGDDLAKNVVREAAFWFALGIHNLTLTLDPEIVVIQGVYAEAGNYFQSELLSHLEHVSLVRAPNSVKVVFSSLGEDAASLGAASYVLSKAFG